MQPALPTMGSIITAAMAVRMRGKRRFNRGEVVVRQSQCQASDFLRNACRAGNAKSRNAGAGFHQKTVGVAVIAAFEFDDDLAAGGGARHADRGHGGLGAGADEAHLFDCRIAGRDALCKIGLGCSGCAEACGVARRSLDGFDDRWKCVAENHRTPRSEIVDISIAVGVVEIRALGALNEWRGAADRAKCPHRRVHAARKEPLGALLQCL